MPSNPHQPDPNFPDKRHDELASATSSEFTRLFSSTVPVAAQPAAKPSHEPPPAADGFTQLFQRIDAVPTHADNAHTTAADATLIFEALPASDIAALAPATQQQPGSAPLPVKDIPASEFTTVFTALAPPVAPAPSSHPAPAVPPASGEFTQFFSAVSAREIAAQSGDLEVARSRQNSAQQTQTQKPADHPSHANAQGSSAAATDQESKNTAPGAAQGGSFTQLFQQMQPSPSHVAATPVAGAFSASGSPPPQASSGVLPAFGQPQGRAGAFTDVFATPASTNTPIGMSSPGKPQQNAPTTQGGFTELFRPAHVSPQSTPSALPLSGAGAFSWPADPPAPSSPVIAAVPGSGEFTKLMRSLSPSAQPREQEQASGGADHSFFGSAATPGSYTGQESEFTRVQRASARREGAPQSLSPAPAVQALVEAPVAPHQGKDAPRETSGKKSRTLVILLVVMNVLLLLGLIVLGFLVLRRK